MNDELQNLVEQLRDSSEQLKAHGGTLMFPGWDFESADEKSEVLAHQIRNAAWAIVNNTQIDSNVKIDKADSARPSRKHLMARSMLVDPWPGDMTERCRPMNACCRRCRARLRCCVLLGVPATTAICLTRGCWHSLCTTPIGCGPSRRGCL
jgi:hypothetical protein